MREIRGRFIESIMRTPTVTSFRFAPAEKMDFFPGQFVQVIFDEADRNNKELNKYLSFSCAPGKLYFEVTKRLSESRFSQRLRGLKVNDEMLFRAPMGSCVLKPEYKKVCFLIGGIGITPVISMFEYITEKKLDTDACLVYSNRTDEDIAFKKELDLWRSANKNLKVSYVVTECQPKDNTCIFGTINAGLVKSRICDFQERVFFIFGPPRMVEAMNNLCLGLGCDKENINTENFIGY